MLFGVFARAQKTVTKEDFKYTVLKRLHLNKEITEREIDMFLRGNPRLLDREILTLEDFLMIFSAAITQARNDFLNEEAMQMNTIKKYEMLTTSAKKQNEGGFGRSFGGGDQSENVFRDTLGGAMGKTQLSFTESEILEILGKMK